MHTKPSEGCSTGCRLEHRPGQGNCEFFHLPICCARVGDPEANLLNSTSYKRVILVHGWVHDQIHLWGRGWSVPEGRAGLNWFHSKISTHPQFREVKYMADSLRFQLQESELLCGLWRQVLDLKPLVLHFPWPGCHISPALLIVGQLPHLLY